jgi:hypothetical protein
MNLMPILSPYPPYKSVSSPMMTVSSRNKIVNELRNGFFQIKMTLSSHMNAIGGLIRQV